jgi:hypothetical protein
MERQPKKKNNSHLKLLSASLLIFFLIQYSGVELAYSYDSNDSRKYAATSPIFLMPVGYSQYLPPSYSTTKSALDAQDQSEGWMSQAAEGFALLIDQLKAKKKKAGDDSSYTADVRRTAVDPKNNNTIAAGQELRPVGAYVDKTPPVLIRIAVINITASGAMLNWGTTEKSTSQVQYGPTTAYGKLTVLDTTLTTAHSVNLTALSPNLLYHYRLLSRDEAGNLMVTQDYTFRTAQQDLTPPVLSTTFVSSLSTTNAVISWSTNEASTTQIEYGSAVDAFGNPLYGNSTSINNSLVTSHSQTLQNLAAGTTYHYRVKSKDAAGNLAISKDYTFVTLGTSIRDAALAKMVQTDLADGLLDRADMLGIFRQVEADGVVSATEFSDLQTIQKNSSLYKELDPVRVLANKVVLGNVANSTIGNLTSGSSAAQLEKLVGKWFLGTDHPVTSYTYQKATGSLFVNGDTYTDIKQGYLGDCYFMASLAEVALRQPADISNMFTDNGDGTYTVRFYEGGVADYLTVDRWLPVDSKGRLVYADLAYSASDPNTELWAALLEKAYATERYGSNTYASIEGGWMGTVLTEVTNHPNTSIYLTNFNAVVNAWNAGALMTLASYWTQPTGSPVVGGHAYAIVGYNSATQKFSIFNPWGIGYGLLSLSWSQIQTYYQLCQYVNP